MHPYSWIPSLEALTVSKTSLQHPSIRIEAELKCEGCLRLTSAETIYLLGEIPLETTIECLVNDLKKSRACQRCGAMSVIPQKDVDGLLRKLSSEVTPAWVEANKKKLMARA